MTRILLYGIACALAPALLARLHPVLCSATRPLVYLLVAAQILVVPIAVALEPDISFGSNVYSLGAGLSIMLIGAVELVFIAGSGLGLTIATAFLNRGEHDLAYDRWMAVQRKIEDP